ncbi:MAG: methyltransferase domain-containing protein [bacterium]|nr:methyltransferase domain-containing protein [bacterium]
MTEWQGAEYEAVSRLQQELAAAALGAVTLADGEHVLDVGCGDGRVTAAIAARTPSGRVLGVDPSHDMIAFAARTHAAPNLAFEVGDARTLGHAGAFDRVVSFNALHWVHEQDAALRAIHAALRPGGRALLQLVPRTQRRSLEDAIEAVAASPPWTAQLPAHRTPFAHPYPGAFAALAESAGFAIERLEVLEGAFDFGSRAAFARFAHATFVAWTGELPADLIDAFIADVLDRWAGGTIFAYDQLRVALRRP